MCGLQSADRGSHELFTLHKAGRLTRLIKLQLPAALPAMFAGFRVAAGLSVIGAIVGEIYFKQGVAGLGTLLSAYLAYVNFPPLFAAVLLSSLLGIAVFVLFSVLDRLVVGRWYKANRGCSRGQRGGQARKASLRRPRTRPLRHARAPGQGRP